MARINIVYSALVRIPVRYRDYFWDDAHGAGETSIEKLIVRVLIYGSSADIAEIACDYPEETLEIIDRYREQLPLARGLRAFVIRKLQAV